MGPGANGIMEPMSPSPINNPSAATMAERLTLEWPSSVAVFDQYAQAQKAVDHLADNAFPVQNVMIVGTDLRQVERVTGRLTQQKVALGGLASGMWMGLFVGLIFSIFDGQGMRTIITTVLFGALFGLVWALLGYAFTRGKRDFTSVSQVVATKYEVLVEHQVQAQAREMLRGAGLLGAQGAMPRQDVPPAPPTGQQPYDLAPPTGSDSTGSGATRAGEDDPRR